MIFQLGLGWSSTGNFNQPHLHLHDRYHIYVIKGTWWVGAGAHVDPGISVPIPAGSYVQHLTNHLHWDGAKNEEAWVLVVGEGPGTLNLVEEAK